MTQAYTGEIQLFAFPFAPVNWAMCSGQLLPISQYTALFSLIGTYYGGDGRATFALPNLNGNAPCSQGQGPGLSMRTIGEVFGETQITLNTAEMPPHTHAMMLYVQPDTSKRAAAPQANYGLVTPANPTVFTSSAPNVSFSPNAIGMTGGSQPHANQQPYLVANFCICLNGVFPQFG